LWSRQEEHAAALGQLEELKKLVRDADSERAGLLAARARENEERAGERAEREQLADEKARLEGEVLARDGERARLAALEGELMAAQCTIAELRGGLQSQDGAAAAVAAAEASLQEARGAQVQVEEEVRALRAAAAAEAQELTQLLEAVGLPPEGDRLARLGAAARQVREAQGLRKKMEHRVQLLEALRVENDEVIEQLRAQLVTAQEQLTLQLQQPPGDVVAAGGDSGCPAELVAALEALAGDMRVEASGEGVRGEGGGAAGWVVALGSMRKCFKGQEEQAERMMRKIAELEGWRAEHFAGQDDSKALQELAADARAAAEQSAADAEMHKAALARLTTELEAAKSKVVSTEREAQGVISAWEAKVAELNDELADARADLEDAVADKHDALEAAKAEAEEQFAREVGLLRGALDKLRSQVSATSQETEFREKETERLEDEKLLLEDELVQVKEERDAARGALEAERAARAADAEGTREEVGQLRMQVAAAEGLCARANEERDRIQAVLESFHEENLHDSQVRAPRSRALAGSRTRARLSWHLSL